jgi:hypothetical protein
MPDTNDVQGRIGYYNLQDWWLNTFTDSEREYMDARYQPMGASLHTLTQGRILRREGQVTDAAMFLNAFATWFRRPVDAPIYKRIRDKIEELGHSQPISGAGYVRGRHFVTYVEDVKDLKRAGNLEDAEALLLALVQATEEESKARGGGVAPGYYEELAKIYRQTKNYEREVWILERFAGQEHAPGVSPPKLLERLEKARKLLVSGQDAKATAPSSSL